MLNSAALDLLAAREGHVHRWLLWVQAKNRSTGVTEELGLWTGEDNRTFTVDAQSRTYYGAGGLIGISDLVYEAGTNVRMQTLTLGPLTPEVALLLRGYEPRLSPARLHLAIFDPDTMSVLDIDRKFKGWIDAAPIRTGKLGSPTTCEITLASNARAGTKTLASKKSDQTHRLRNDDRFRRYTDISGAVPVWWGQKRKKVDE